MAVCWWSDHSPDTHPINLSCPGGEETHSSILAWRILWAEEDGGLDPWDRKRVGYDLATKQPKFIPTWFHLTWATCSPLPNKSCQHSPCLSSHVLYALYVFAQDYCLKICLSSFFHMRVYFFPDPLGNFPDSAHPAPRTHFFFLIFGAWIHMIKLPDSNRGVLTLKARYAMATEGVGSCYHKQITEASHWLAVSVRDPPLLTLESNIQTTADLICLPCICVRLILSNSSLTPSISDMLSHKLVVSLHPLGNASFSLYPSCLTLCSPRIRCAHMQSLTSD